MWFISHFFADDTAEAEAEPNWKRQSSTDQHKPSFSLVNPSNLFDGR